MNRRFLAAASYLALAALWVYGVVDRGTDPSGWLLPLVAFGQVAIGFVVARWWALVLPVLAVLISVPAKDPPITPDNAEPFPIFVSLGVATIVAVPLVGGGVLLRKLYDRHDRKSSRPKTAG